MAQKCAGNTIPHIIFCVDWGPYLGVLMGTEVLAQKCAGNTSVLPLHTHTYFTLSLILSVPSKHMGPKGPLVRERAYIPCLRR